MPTFAQSVDLSDAYRLGYRSMAEKETKTLGKFNVGGSVGSSIGYSDNIHEDASIEKQSAFREYFASGWLNSDWEQHELSISGRLKKRLFAKDDSAADWRFGNLFAYGRVDFDEDTQLELVGSYNLNSEARGDTIYSYNQAHQADDQRINATAYLAKAFGDTTVTLRGGISFIDKQDALSNAGNWLNRDDANSTLYDTRVRVSTNVAESANLYVEAGYNEWQFDSPVDRNGYSRGSNGYHVAVGALASIDNKFSGEIAFGYRQQHFPDGRFEDLNALTFDAWGTWALNDKTNFTVSADTNFTEETSFGIAANLTRSALAQLDYRLNETTRVYGQGELVYEHTLGSPVGDHQTVYWRAGMDYEFHPHSVLTVEYRHERFNSAYDGGNYEAGEVFAKVEFSY